MRDIPRGVKVRVMFEDEGRFGRINDKRRCWAPMPLYPEVSTQVVREFIYAMTVVEPFEGALFSLVMPYADTETMSIFLTHIGLQFSESFNIIFLDGAGWHRSDELRIPDNVKVILLPPYSPELNPVEAIWKYLRENYFGNKTFDSLDEIEEALCFSLSYLNQNPEIIHSMTCFDWINTISLTEN